MSELRFEWDRWKNRVNQRKHGVSFEEASSVFFDTQARQFFDPDHSQDEDRFLLLGMSIRLRTLIVCHCFREGETVIRIVSARKADKEEEQQYWEAANMRKHYDFSKLKGRKNPFAKYLKQPVTMRLDRDTVAYFKSMAKEIGMPYQSLINLYLRDCAMHRRELRMEWAGLPSTK